MKYGELINFEPIESVIVLRSADDSARARELVSSYIMSDHMEELISARILSQLRLDHVVDNKGVLLVGNYGTGKSHLMSAISAIAEDAGMLPLLKNEKFQREADCIAGKFEVLRIEIGSTEMSLRGIITMNIERDLARRGIHYKFPDVRAITNNKDALTDMMAAFAQKYGDERGYLIVVDELLDYLRTRKDSELIVDLGFMRELGEIIKSTRLRLICGVQEALFDNSNFRQVSKILLKVKDRFEQVLIRSEDIAYVAQRRVLKKNADQRARIREHLTRFAPLYEHMAERLEDYVDMYPIHPAYIQTFQRIVTVEKREVLRTISDTISAILDDDVPENAPGIISYDSYWQRIREDPSLRTEASVSEVLSKSQVLEDILRRSFPKKPKLPMALRIIHALSVHRLTTGTLDARLGLTAQNLKDELCLCLPTSGMGQDSLLTDAMEESFLLTTISTVLKDIMNTVSGQFIEYNPENGQYFLNLRKDIDYDKKIQEKADFLGDDKLNSYYYELMITALDWQADEYVSGYKIYQYELNWEEKNIFRNGYLFLGTSAERPTAQPEEDFYAYILPPFGESRRATPGERDEVCFTLQYDDKFVETLRLYSGAREMEIISAAGEAKSVYTQRAHRYLVELRRWMDEHKARLFQVAYAGESKLILNYLRGLRMNELTVKGALDHAVSLALNPWFMERYPEFPRFPTAVTSRNMATVRQEALNTLMGHPTQLGNRVLDAFGMLADGVLKPERSKYVAYYMEQLQRLPAGKVLNYDDIMVKFIGEQYVDRQFHLDDVWMTLVLAALVWLGRCVLVGENNERFDAGNMEELCRCDPTVIYYFRRLEQPKQVNKQMLLRLFNAFGLSPGLLVNESTWPRAVEELHRAAQAQGAAALEMGNFLQRRVTVWGELLIPLNEAEQLRARISAIHRAADDVRSRFTTPAKLKNFDYDDARMAELEDGFVALKAAKRARGFWEDTQDMLGYLVPAQLHVKEGTALYAEFEEKKDMLMALRERVLEEDCDCAELLGALAELKEKYIAYYMDAHGRFRLDHAGAGKKNQLAHGPVMSTLMALRAVSDILPLAQLDTLVSQLNELRVCYECTTPELECAPVCPHCRFDPADEGAKPVTGRLAFIEQKLDELLEEWTRRLLGALADPMLESQRALLTQQQRRLIDDFTSSGVLPQPVGADFIEAVNALFAGMESVELDLSELHSAMSSWSPCPPDDFRQKFNAWLEERLRGKDRSKVRIVIK